MDSGWIFMGSIWTGMIIFAVRVARKNKLRIANVRNYLFSKDFIPASPGSSDIFRSAEPRTREARILSSYEGTYNNRSAVVTEFRFGGGKGSYKQTFVGVRKRSGEKFMPAPFVASLELEFSQSDAWLIGTIPQITLDAEAIEGYLRCFT